MPLPARNDCQRRQLVMMRTPGSFVTQEYDCLLSYKLAFLDLALELQNELSMDDFESLSHHLDDRMAPHLSEPAYSNDHSSLRHEIYFGVGEPAVNYCHQLYMTNE